jgi:hypothetical protein
VGVVGLEGCLGYKVGGEVAAAVPAANASSNSSSSNTVLAASTVALAAQGRRGWQGGSGNGYEA